ncbi:Putative nuclease, partial [Frankliniella fusca]
NYNKFHIPDVLGFIDGTEVSIVTPAKCFNPQLFWTRKHHYAINCQTICDSDLRILNITAYHPGCCTDKFIFKNSAARRRMQTAFAEQPCWLLAPRGSLGSSPLVRV